METVMYDSLGKFENNRIMAITSAKIEADSAIACPTSIDLKISPVALGLREMAKLA